MIQLCDKKCGTGKFTGQNTVCSHNNLEVLFPNLLCDWHEDNPPMSDYNFGSGKRVLWRCSKNTKCDCPHVWEAIIGDRTGKQSTGCPWCSQKKLCVHTNLAALYPHLLLEWHFSNDLIVNYAPSSNKKVLWSCPNNNICECPHEWIATINSRTCTKSSNCPWCSNRMLCEHTNLAAKYPHLLSEWHPDNGLISDYSINSKKIVKWQCLKNVRCECPHIWNTTISSRTSKQQSGCPWCSNFYLCDHTNLAAKFPHLVVEWHPDNDPMINYSPSSGKYVKWKCSNATCDCHVWYAHINNRTNKGSRCPFCYGSRQVCKHINLETQFPELIPEYSSDNIKLMNQYSSSSNERVLWVCSVDISHIWRAAIRDRTGYKKTGCPHCSRSPGYSVKQIKWLTEIETKENILIQHARKPEGEYKLPIVGKVDGYCVTNNTIYEFHGDYWHGNPIKFNRDDMHPISKKTFGELYDKTIIRDAMIKSMGYNLVTMWESDYERSVKVPKFDNQIDNIDDNEQKVIDITNDDMIDAVQPYTV